MEKGSTKKQTLEIFKSSRYILSFSWTCVCRGDEEAIKLSWYHKKIIYLLNWAILNPFPSTATWQTRAAFRRIHELYANLARPFYLWIEEFRNFNLPKTIFHSPFFTGRRLINSLDFLMELHPIGVEHLLYCECGCTDRADQTYTQTNEREQFSLHRATFNLK